MSIKNHPCSIIKNLTLLKIENSNGVQSCASIYFLWHMYKNYYFCCPHRVMYYENGKTEKKYPPKFFIKYSSQTIFHSWFWTFEFEVHRKNSFSNNFSTPEIATSKKKYIYIYILCACVVAFNFNYNYNSNSAEIEEKTGR